MDHLKSRLCSTLPLGILFPCFIYFVCFVQFLAALSILPSNPLIAYAMTSGSEGIFYFVLFLSLISFACLFLWLVCFVAPKNGQKENLEAGTAEAMVRGRKTWPPREKLVFLLFFISFLVVFVLFVFSVYFLWLVQQWMLLWK